jgi:hypothetical protein
MALKSIEAPPRIARARPLRTGAMLRENRRGHRKVEARPRSIARTFCASGFEQIVARRTREKGTASTANPTRSAAVKRSDRQSLAYWTLTIGKRVWYPEGTKQTLDSTTNDTTVPMNITLHLSPEKQAELEQRAAAAGADLSSFILEAVQEKLETRNGASGETVPYEQWQHEFRSWIAAQQSRNPHFDDSRESIYD